MEKKINNTRQARLAVLLDLYAPFRDPPNNSMFHLMVTFREWRKVNGTFSKFPIVPYPDTNWSAPRSTGLSPPIINPRRQSKQFENLVDILFNEKGEWTDTRIQRAIKLIEKGARITINPNPQGAWNGANMKIWENLEGDCIAEPQLELGTPRNTWRINAQRAGYRDGWHYPGFVLNAPWPPGPFMPPQQLNENGISLGPWMQLIPPGAPPRVARLEFIAAQEASRALSPHANQNQRRQAQDRIRRASDAVKAQIGWEMPGGDLLGMVVKKKIPLEIITTLLDYGMHTKMVHRDAFNDHKRALQIANDAEVSENDAMSSFMVPRWDGVGGGPYANYFHPGWDLDKFRNTACIHFIIKQYAQSCLSMALPGQQIIIPGREMDYKYYTDLLKLIFRRHCRLIGEEGALDNHGNPIIPGMNYVDNYIIDSPEYQDIYKQYFPRLTTIAQTTINQYKAAIDSRPPRRFPQQSDAMVTEHGPSSTWQHNGGRRKTRKRRRSRKKRGGNRRKKKTRKMRTNNKISIPINWDSHDKGYQTLQSQKVKKFLSQNFKEGNNLIQTQPGKPFKAHGKTTLHLHAISVNSWPIKISWNEIRCKSYKNWIKATPCDWGTTRLFVKFKSNKKIAGFGTYLNKLIKGKISQKKHNEFVYYLQKVMGNLPIQIHNQEVDWFHLKEN